MSQDNASLANRLVICAVVLTRWLRAADPAPQLSGPHASALAIIVNGEGIKPSTLAALEEVKRPTIARTIAELEALGLILRQRNATDGRSVWLFPTPQGQALFDAGQKRRIQPLRAALDNLTPADGAKIEAAVRVLEDVLSVKTDRASQP